jgi:hypothetical protein
MAARASDEYTTSSESGSEADRPNRWEGPSSTWQDMNREEINTLTALDEIRNRDLSVHLYNTFALKQRHGGTSSAVGDDHQPVPEKVCFWATIYLTSIVSALRINYRSIQALKC